MDEWKIIRKKIVNYYQRVVTLSDIESVCPTTCHPLTTQISGSSSGSDSSGSDSSGSNSNRDGSVCNSSGSEW